ncbi:cold shock domain-containing protein [Allohahella marinimesophila]|uniref:CSD domain-containing protein n=1 Tax=Allohahella marinimesophila TaxID=1054972 RepID=A0ABP7PQR2_9GAMM
MKNTGSSNLLPILIYALVAPLLCLAFLALSGVSIISLVAGDGATISADPESPFIFLISAKGFMFYLLMAALFFIAGYLSNIVHLFRKRAEPAARPSAAAPKTNAAPRANTAPQPRNQPAPRQHEATTAPEQDFAEDDGVLGEEYGTVKWFNVKKGFGFITLDDGEEIFVHFRSIKGAGHRHLKPGQEVRFNIVEGEKGPQAEDVSVVSEG